MAMTTERQFSQQQDRFAPLICGYINHVQLTVVSDKSEKLFLKHREYFSGKSDQNVVETISPINYNTLSR